MFKGRSESEPSQVGSISSVKFQNFSLTIVGTIPQSDSTVSPQAAQTGTVYCSLPLVTVLVPVTSVRLPVPSKMVTGGRSGGIATLGVFRMIGT